MVVEGVVWSFEHRARLVLEMGLRASGLRFGQEAAWMSVSLVRQSAVQPQKHEVVYRHHASN